MLGEKKSLEEAYKVIERVTGESDLPVSFVLKSNKKKSEGKTFFQYEVDKGVLKIEGSSPVALCRGFYDK